MDKSTETNSPEKVPENLCADYKKFLFFGEEESAAICGYIPMTQEIFDRCFRIAAACWDSESIRYIFKKFPEFAEK